MYLVTTVLKNGSIKHYGYGSKAYALSKVEDFSKRDDVFSAKIISLKDDMKLVDILRHL